jgi:hypothetical protein
MTHETPRSVKVIRVIEVVAIRGAGVEGDPVREVRQYWSLDGVMLAEKDKGIPDTVTMSIRWDGLPPPTIDKEIL